MVAPITVLIQGDASGLQGVAKGASAGLGTLGKSLAAVIPGGVATTKAIKGVAKATKSVSIAAKDAAAEEQIFADVMSNATSDFDANTGAVDEAIKASQKLAFTDTETRKAIAAISTATGETSTALRLLTVAQDVARVSGTSLEQAADAVAKAQAGQDTALKRMLPGLETGATAQETIANASKLAAGAADTYGESSEAAAKKSQIGFEELKETIGAKVVPAMKALFEAAKPVFQLLLDLAKIVLPPLLDLLEKLFKVAGKVATAVSKIVDAVSKLTAKIKELLKPLTEAVNKLQNLDLNPFSRAVGVAGQAVGVAATASGGGGRVPQGVTINIYGDPAVIEARVIRALKGYQSRNGTASLITGGRW